MYQSRLASSEPGLGEILFRPFDHIYIINLDERHDRWHRILRDLAELGITLPNDKFERFNALKFPESLGFPTSGARGCFLSHLAVLKDALEKNFETIAIIEDDCAFELPGPISLLGYNIAVESEDWDLFYPGYHNVTRFQNEGSGILDVADRYCIGGAHFYSVRKKILPSLIDHLESALSELEAGVDREGHVDVVYTEFRAETPGIKTLVASPAWAFQRRTLSNVQPRRTIDQLGFMMGPMAMLRGVAGAKKSW